MNTHALESAARRAPALDWMHAFLQLVRDGCEAAPRGLQDEYQTEPLHFTSWLALKANLVRRTVNVLRTTRRGETFGKEPAADVLALIVAFADKAKWARRRRGPYGAGFFDKQIAAMTPALMRRIATRRGWVDTRTLVDEVFESLAKQWIFRDVPGLPPPKERLESSLTEGLLRPLAWLGAVTLREQAGRIVAVMPTPLLHAFVEQADDADSARRVRGVTIAMKAASAEELLAACSHARLEPSELEDAGRAYRDVNGESVAAELVALFETAGPRLFALHHLARGVPWPEILAALKSHDFGIITIEALVALANDNNTVFSYTGSYPPAQITAQVTAWQALGAARHAGKWQAYRIVKSAPDELAYMVIECIGASKHPNAKMVLRAITRFDHTLACAALDQLYPRPDPVPSREDA